MKRRLLSALLSMLLLAGCGGPDGGSGSTGYTQIDAETAHAMMADEPDAVILDVRESDEYAGGHIPGAVLLPVGTIDADTASSAIGEKDTTVLVYCRSGNRSKRAAATLAQLGYTAVYEFGGIQDWPYDIE